MLIGRKSKSLLFIMLFVVVMVSSAQPVSINSIEHFSLFKRALVMTESRGNTKVIAKDGSTGILQIQPVLVKAVNRYCKNNGIEKKYTLQDRFSETKSWEMFDLYQKSIWREKVPTLEQIARVWNGGPNGHKNRKTISYWNKIKRNMKYISVKYDYNEKSDA